MKDLIKINKDNLKNHFYYGKWFYIVAVILAIFLVNISYTTTKPRFPKESTIPITMFAGVGNEEVLKTWEDEMLNILPDNQREVNIIDSVSIDAATQSVLVARIAAQEDDILVASIEDMESLTYQGAFATLDEIMDLDSIINIFPEVNWDEYYYEVEGADEADIYWIPLYMVEGFDKSDLYGENLGIAILRYSVNQDNAVKCLEYMLTLK